MTKEEVCKACRAEVDLHDDAICDCSRCEVDVMIDEIQNDIAFSVEIVGQLVEPIRVVGKPADKSWKEILSEVGFEKVELHESPIFDVKLDYWLLGGENQ